MNALCCIIEELLSVAVHGGNSFLPTFCTGTRGLDHHISHVSSSKMICGCTTLDRTNYKFILVHIYSITDYFL